MKIFSTYSNDINSYTMTTREERLHLKNYIENANKMLHDIEGMDNGSKKYDMCLDLFELTYSNRPILINDGFRECVLRKLNEVHPTIVELGTDIQRYRFKTVKGNIEDYCSAIAQGYIDEEDELPVD